MTSAELIRPVRVLIVDDSGVEEAPEIAGWDVRFAASGASVDTSFAPDIVLSTVRVEGAIVVPAPLDLEEALDHLHPVVRRLGLAPTSRTVGELVLDESTSEVWRGDERIPLTPLEFELLRALVERPGTSQSLGQLLMSVTRRGVRVPREFATRMIERMRSLVNGAKTELVQLDGTGRWVLAGV